MKNKVIQLLQKVLDDFNLVWSGHDEKNDGLEKCANQIIDLLSTPQPEATEVNCQTCNNIHLSVCTSCTIKFSNWTPEKVKAFNEFTPIKQPEAKCTICANKDDSMKCASCREKIIGGEDWFMKVEPEEAKEWRNLLALDMADFYLEIYASRDTLSRAKIMEMFRDYHNVKLSNIKKDNLKTRSDIITLLDKYSTWLTKNGYLDTDWNAEEPFAIDEFLKEL